MSDAFPNLSGPPIDINLYPNAASAGINAGNAQKTPLQAGIEGAVEGVKTGIQVVQGFQNIQANAQNAEIRQNTIENFPTTNALQQAELTQTQQLNTIRQNQIDNLPAAQKLEALKTQAEFQAKDAQTQKALAEVSKINLELKKQTDDSERESRVSSYFSQIRSDNVGAGLQNIENNLSDVARTAVDYSAGGKPKLNEAVLLEMSDLVYQAQKTGQPELVQQAQRVTDKFQQTLDNVTGAGNSGKNRIDIGGTRTQNAPGAAANASAQAIPSTDPAKNVLADVEKQATAEGKTVIPAAQAKKAFDVNDTFDLNKAGKFPPTQSIEEYGFPAKEGKLDVIKALEHPAVKKEYEDSTPIADRLLTDSTDVFNARVDAYYKKALELNPKAADDPVQLNQIIKAATFAASRGNPTAAEIEENTKTTKGILALQETTTSLTGIFTRLQDIQKRTGEMDVPIGPSETLSAYIGRLSAKAGSEEDAEYLDNVGNQLDKLGNLADLQQVIAAAGSFRVADTDKERERITGLSFGTTVSLEQNLAALLTLKAKGQQLANVQQVRDMLTNASRSSSEINTAVNQYARANPAFSDELDIINGKRYPTGNRNLRAPGEFVNDLLDGKRVLNKTALNRTIVAPPATTKDAAAILQVVTDPKRRKQLDGLSIPDRLPDGPSADLIAKQALVESSGNPDAVGKETKHGTAKGMMQFIDSTGQDWFKKSGFDEYDPFNAEQSIVAGTKYMKYLLAEVGGDTRLAVAAYNSGVGTVTDAMVKAKKHTGDTSWETVQLYTKQTEENRKETVDYVKKVMGDDKSPDQIRTDLAKNVKSSLGALVTPDAIAYAQENLSIEGLQEADKLKDIDNIVDTKGTILEKPIKALLSPNPETLNNNDPDVFERFNTTVNKLEHSFLIGAARMIALGGDDEIYAGVRAGLYGEDWGVAIQRARVEKEQAFQDYPWVYRAGMAAGLAGTALTGVLPASMKGVAALSFGAGYLEGEGGPVNRGISGTVSAAFGLLIGKLIGPALSLGGATVNKVSDLTSKIPVLGEILEGTAKQFGGAVQNIAKKADVKLPTGSLPSTVKKTKPEKRLAENTGSLTTPELKTAAQKLQTDKELRLGDVAPEGSLNAALSAAGRQPGAAGAARVDSGSRLGEVEDITKKALDRSGAKNIEPEKALNNLNTALEGNIANRTTKRNTEADILYEKWRNSLPQRPGLKGRSKAVPIVTNPDLVKLIGKVDPATKKIVGGHPEVKEAIKQAQNELADEIGKLPRNSADVLRRARTILGEKSKELTGEAGKGIRDGFNKLTQVMTDSSHAGGSKFAKATTEFKSGSENIAAVADAPTVRKLLSALDKEKTTDVNKAGNTLLSFGATELKTLMKELQPSEQQAVKDAVRGYISNVLKARGKRLEGSPQAFPDFSTKFTSDKLRAVFGDAKGGALAKALEKSLRISRLPNEVLAKGSHTHSLGEESNLGKVNIAKGAAQAAVGAATGSSANLAAGTVKTGGGVRDFFTNKGKLDPETAKGMVKIILSDRTTGLAFLRKEIKDRAAREGWSITKKQLTDGLRRLVPAGTSVGVNFDVGSRTQPYSSKIREQMRRKKLADKK